MITTVDDVLSELRGMTSPKQPKRAESPPPPPERSITSVSLEDSVARLERVAATLHNDVMSLTKVVQVLSAALGKVAKAQVPKAEVATTKANPVRESKPLVKGAAFVSDPEALKGMPDENFLLNTIAQAEKLPDSRPLEEATEGDRAVMTALLG